MSPESPSCTRRRRGASGMTYALALGLMAMAALGSVAMLGGGVKTLLTNAGNALGNASPGGGGSGAAPPPPDRMPDPFGFTDVTGAGPGSVRQSNAVQVTGISAGTEVAASGGTLRVCVDSACAANPAFAADGTIGPGEYLQLQMTATSTPNSSSTMSVTVGTGTPVDWSVATGLPDTTPTLASFPAVDNAAPGATVTSAINQATEFDGPLTVTLTGNHSPAVRVCSLSDCSDASFTSGSPLINPGQYVQFRQTISGFHGENHGLGFTIGSRNGNWSVTTQTDGGYIYSRSTNCYNNRQSNTCYGSLYYTRGATGWSGSLPGYRALPANCVVYQPTNNPNADGYLVMNYSNYVPGTMYYGVGAVQCSGTGPSQYTWNGSIRGCTWDGSSFTQWNANTQCTRLSGETCYWRCLPQYR